MKTFKLLGLLVVVSMTAFAQRGGYTGVTYNIGFPTGRLNDLISETSFSGIGVDINGMVSENVSAGGNLNWSLFDELRRGYTAEIPNGAVTGTQVRSVNVSSFLANIRYFFSERGRDIRPLIGLNAGAYYIRERLDIGIWTLEDYNWHAGLAPEVGLYFLVGRDTFIMTMLRYNYAFDSGTDLVGRDANQYSYWGLHIGIGTDTGLW